MRERGSRGARGVRLNPQHDERTRAKIQTSQIANRLSDHVFGKVEMSPTQVKAAEILLRKTLPDLSAGTLETTIRHEIADIPDAELAAIATGSGPGASEQTDSETRPDRVH
jgi:hypothetical protein